jgi:glucokinase
VTLFLGIDIGGTNIKAALVSEDGRARSFVRSPWSGRAPAEAVSVAGRLLEELGSPDGAEPPAGCGAGCAGLVDSRAGTVHLSPNLPEWRDVGLRHMLTEALGLPTVIENDANAAAYAEYVVGAARGVRSAVLITLGTGVGGGLILDGRLHRGSGFAGEVGHATIERDGEPCACGNAGCLERYVSAGAIVRSALSLLEQGRPSALSGAGEVTAEAVGEAACGGDELALEVLAEAGRALGVGLANLALILAPDLFVIGGGVAAAGEPLLGPAREEMERRAYCRGPSTPGVVPAELGETAGVVGAALLAREAKQAG